SRIMVNGRIYQKSLRTKSEKVAINRDAAFRVELHTGEHFPGEVSNSIPTLHEFESRFFGALKLKIQPSSFKVYETMWKPLVRYIPLATTRLDKIAAALIEQFIQARAANKIKAFSNTGPQDMDRTATATVNHSLRVLSRALRLAEEWKLIKK